MSPPLFTATRFHVFLPIGEISSGAVDGAWPDLESLYNPFVPALQNTRTLFTGFVSVAHVPGCIDAAGSPNVVPVAEMRRTQ